MKFPLAVAVALIHIFGPVVAIESILSAHTLGLIIYEFLRISFQYYYEFGLILSISSNEKETLDANSKPPIVFLCYEQAMPNLYAINLKGREMASSTDFKKLLEKYQEEGAPMVSQ